jgi:hypothetical protein
MSLGEAHRRGGQGVGWGSSMFDVAFSIEHLFLPRTWFQTGVLRAILFGPLLCPAVVGIRMLLLSKRGLSDELVLERIGLALIGAAPSLIPAGWLPGGATPIVLIPLFFLMAALGWVSVLLPCKTCPADATGSPRRLSLFIMTMLCLSPYLIGGVLAAMFQVSTIRLFS